MGGEKITLFDELIAIDTLPNQQACKDLSQIDELGYRDSGDSVINRFRKDFDFIMSEKYLLSTYGSDSITGVDYIKEVTSALYCFLGQVDQILSGGVCGRRKYIKIKYREGGDMIGVRFFKGTAINNRLLSERRVDNLNEFMNDFIQNTHICILNLDSLFRKEIGDFEDSKMLDKKEVATLLAEFRKE